MPKEISTCQVKNCTSSVRCVGLCALHYDRKRRAKTDDFDKSVVRKFPLKSGRTCEHCDRGIYRGTLCRYHYDQNRRDTCTTCGAPCTRNRRRCMDCVRAQTAPKGGTWVCTYCKKEKPEVKFGRRYDAHGTEKLRSRCRSCETNTRTKVRTTDIVSTYGTTCHICLEPIDMFAPRKVGVPGWERGFHREHVISLADGGANTLENCRPAHGICNLTKKRKP